MQALWLGGLSSCLRGCSCGVLGQLIVDRARSRPPRWVTVDWGGGVGRSALLGCVFCAAACRYREPAWPGHKVPIKAGTQPPRPYRAAAQGIAALCSLHSDRLG